MSPPTGQAAVEAPNVPVMQLDTLITNANIITGDPDRPRARSVGLWNGSIVGVDDQLGALADSATNVIDAGGATVTPGFNDVHAHSVMFGESMIEINLAECVTAEQIYEALDSWCSGDNTSGIGDWAVASNYRPLQITGDALRIDVLDRVTRGRPLVIKHNSAHAYTANSEALRRAGIALTDPEQPDNGVIGTDTDGHVTGLLDENAMRPLQALIQPEPQALLQEALNQATSRYVSEGLTSVTDAGIAGGWIGHSPREFAAYQTARDAGLLSTRMQTMVTIDALHDVPGAHDDPEVRSLTAGVRTGVGDEWLQIGPTKVFSDGSLIGSTAAMSEDYHHCNHHGYFQGDPAVMRERALAAAAGGWSIAMHAIGDAAVVYATEVIAEAQRRYGAPSMPHRIEHGGVVTTEQLTKIARENAVLVPQPQFIAEFGDAMADKLGPARTELSYPAKRILDAGIVLPGSSDRPVADGAPLTVMQAFVQRRTETGQPYGPDDRITVEQALHAYTVGSAKATGWYGRKGQVRSGQLADLVILGEDLTKVPADRISSVPVLATYVGGRCVYGDSRWGA